MVFVLTKRSLEPFVADVRKEKALSRRRGSVQGLMLPSKRNAVQLKRDVVTSPGSLERPVKADSYGF